MSDCQRILIADTETTNVDHTAEVCEVAFIEIDEELNVLREFQSLIKPSVAIAPEASAASHITNAMVEDAPTAAEVFATLPSGYFDDVFIIAHNCQFDYRMLKMHWNITGQLCTLKAARRYLPHAPNHKLQTLRYYLELQVDAGAHRAMADVLTLKALLPELTKASGLSLAELVEACYQPVKVERMPWGKYQGVALKDLPSQYVNWLLTKTTNLDDDLRASLEKLR